MKNMMLIKKRLVFMAMFLLLPLFYLSAQTNQGKITGTIFDRSGDPVEIANVILLRPDSTFVEGVITDTKGKYQIDVAMGNYLLQVTSLGFEDIYQAINLKGDLLRKDFELTQSSIMLQEVEAVGKKNMVKREVDRLIFDASAVASSSFDAFDILRKVPGIMVMGDNITMLGTQGVRVLINGRDQKMSGAELATLLKSYEASQIDKVEVIMNPSSKHDAQGAGGVINIKLKKAQIDYINSTLNYNHTFSNLQSDAFSANILYNKDRINASLNGNGSFNNREMDERTEEISSNFKRKNALDYLSDSRNYALRGHLDYRLGEGSLIGVMGYYSNTESGMDKEGELKYFSLEDNLVDSLLLSDIHDESYSDNFRINTYADIKLDTMGKLMKIDVDYIDYKFDGKDDFSSRTFDPQMDYIGGDFHYKNQNRRDIQAFTSALDFVLPYKGYTLNFGAKASLSDSDYKMNQTDHTDLDDQSDDFNFKENIYALYMNFDKRFGKAYHLKLGVRVEHTHTIGENRVMNSRHINNYTNVFPSFMLGYVHDKDNRFNFSLLSLIDRPSFVQLNPFVRYVSKFTTKRGDPSLKSSPFWKLNMGYTYKGSLSIDAFYRYSTNNVSEIQKPDPNSLLVHTYYENAETSHGFGFQNSYMLGKLSWMNLFLIQELSYDIYLSNSTYTLDRRVGVNYVAMVNSSFFFNKSKTLVGSVNGMYVAPKNTATVDISSKYALNIGLNYTLMKGKMRLALNGNNLLSSRVKGKSHGHDYELNFNHRMSYPSVNLGVTYTLGARLSGKRFQNSDIQNRM